jgi:hypothetical protein
MLLCTLVYFRLDYNEFYATHSATLLSDNANANANNAGAAAAGAGDDDGNGDGY